MGPPDVDNEGGSGERGSGNSFIGFEEGSQNQETAKRGMVGVVTAIIPLCILSLAFIVLPMYYYCCMRKNRDATGKSVVVVVEHGIEQTKSQRGSVALVADVSAVSAVLPDASDAPAEGERSLLKQSAQLSVG